MDRLLGTAPHWHTVTSQARPWDLHLADAPGPDEQPVGAVPSLQANHIDHGQDERNPLDSVHFFDSLDTPVMRKLHPAQISSMMVASFQVGGPGLGWVLDLGAQPPTCLMVWWSGESSCMHRGLGRLPQGPVCSQLPPPPTCLVPHGMNVKGALVPARNVHSRLTNPAAPSLPPASRRAAPCCPCPVCAPTPAAPTLPHPQENTLPAHRAFQPLPIAASPQENTLRVYSRSSAPEVVSAIHQAFESWVKERFRGKVNTSTPAKPPRPLPPPAVQTAAVAAAEDVAGLHKRRHELTVSSRGRGGDDTSPSNLIRTKQARQLEHP